MVKWGIALSGGGAPGLAAHLGALDLLFSNGLIPPVMVGASAGGIATGMLAQGDAIGEALAAWAAEAKNPWSLSVVAEELISSLRFLRPSDTPGMLTLEPIIASVNARISGHASALPNSPIWIPRYGVVVSDMTSGESVLLDGSTPGWTASLAMTATAAVPGLFQGIRGTNGHLYQDGGFFDNDPVDQVRRLGADKVLLIRIGVPTQVPGLLSLDQLLQASLSMGLSMLTKANNPASADLVIDVPTQGGLISLHHWHEDVVAGHNAIAAHLPEIRALAGK